MSLSRLLLVSAAVVAGAASAHADTYSFNNSIGATTAVSPFSVTSAGGNVATFSSTPGNSFAVQPTTDLFTFSPALVDNNYSFSPDPLTITFTSPVSGTLSIPFGFLDAFGLFGPDSLTVTASNGQTASYLATLNNLNLPEPEGVVNLALTAPVSSVVLTGTNEFGIGNVSNVTPEPASLVLAGTGVVSFLLRRRRKTDN